MPLSEIRNITNFITYCYQSQENVIQYFFYYVIKVTPSRSLSPHCYFTCHCSTIQRLHLL